MENKSSQSSVLEMSTFDEHMNHVLSTHYVHNQSNQTDGLAEIATGGGNVRNEQKSPIPPSVESSNGATKSISTTISPVSTASTQNTTEIYLVPYLSLWNLFLLFLSFGFRAWGGPAAQIAMIKQELRIFVWKKNIQKKEIR